MPYSNSNFRTNNQQTIGFDWRSLNLLVALEQQSVDIANGVHVNRVEDDIGAGDQVHTKQKSKKHEINPYKENHAGNRAFLQTHTYIPNKTTKKIFLFTKIKLTSKSIQPIQKQHFRFFS